MLTTTVKLSSIKDQCWTAITLKSSLTQLTTERTITLSVSRRMVTQLQIRMFILATVRLSNSLTTRVLTRCSRPMGEIMMRSWRVRCTASLSASFGVSKNSSSRLSQGCSWGRSSRSKPWLEEHTSERDAGQNSCSGIKEQSDIQTQW